MHLVRTRVALEALGVPPEGVTQRLREKFVRHLRRIENQYGVKIYHNPSLRHGVGYLDVEEILKWAPESFDCLADTIPDRAAEEQLIKRYARKP